MNKRGRIENITLTRPISFNDHLILKAVIEIDHINFGLDEKTIELKEKKRSRFSVSDIEKFILQLDGEAIAATRYQGSQSIFVIRIDCPVKGEFFGKTFIMIFKHDHYKTDELYTITLYPGWK